MGFPWNSPCYSPCVASPARKPTGEAYVLSGLVREEAHPIVSLFLLNLLLKALMLKALIACWSSWFYLLITLLEKKYLQQSRVHRNLTRGNSRYRLICALSAKETIRRTGHRRDHPEIPAWPTNRRWDVRRNDESPRRPFKGSSNTVSDLHASALLECSIVTWLLANNILPRCYLMLRVIRRRVELS